jgi:hypothetical protein
MAALLLPAKSAFRVPAAGVSIRRRWDSPHLPLAGSVAGKFDQGKKKARANKTGPRADRTAQDLSQPGSCFPVCNRTDVAMKNKQQHPTWFPTGQTRSHRDGLIFRRCMRQNVVHENDFVPQFD